MSEAEIIDKRLERRKIEQIGVELRVRGFSHQEISQVLAQKHGIYISPSKLQGVIDRGIGRTPVSTANTLRTIEVLRLDKITKAMMDKMDPTPNEDGEQVEAPSFGDQLRAAIILHKISERMCALNGLNLQATLMSIGMVGAQKDAVDLATLVTSLREEAREPEAIDVDSQSS